MRSRTRAAATISPILQGRRLMLHGTLKVILSGEQLRARKRGCPLRRSVGRLPRIQSGRPVLNSSRPVAEAAYEPGSHEQKLTDLGREPKTVHAEEDASRFRRQPTKW